jgi:hypothetical protein
MLPENPRQQIGLCLDCRFSEVVVSGRGSRFYLCLKARNDPRFPRYPTLPVRYCEGYQPPQEETGAEK